MPGWPRHATLPNGVEKVHSLDAQQKRLQGFIGISSSRMGKQASGRRTVTAGEEIRVWMQVMEADV